MNSSDNSPILYLNDDNIPHVSVVSTEPNPIYSGDKYTFVNENILFRRLGGFNEIKGFQAKALGLTVGNEMYKSIDSSKDDITTSDLLRVHLLRILLTIAIFIQMRLLFIDNFCNELKEMINIFWLDLWCVSKLESEALSFGIYFINDISCSVIFTKNLIYNIPTVFYRLIINNILSNNPSSGLQNFNASIPQDFLPKSITLLLEINNDLVSPPPEIPQPYLNADKKITVPDKREIQHALSIRNEYFTHKSVYCAAEKVRLSSEIARFVTWCALIPSINTINIFERFGLLWDNIAYLDVTLEQLGNSILNELSSFANGCYVHELEELKTTLPRITLVDVISGKAYTINEENIHKKFHELEDIDDGIESLISSYTDNRELIVNLCDGRMREDAIINFIKNSADEVEDIDVIQTLREVIPSTPDLIIVPNKSNIEPQKTFGYISINDETDKVPIVYFSKTRFGFTFFVRSLYYFALNNDITEANIVNFVNESNDRHLESHDSSLNLVGTTGYASQNTTIPGHYMIKFVRRMRSLRLFDGNSSRLNNNNNNNNNGDDNEIEPEIIQYDNEPNILLSSAEL
ncbi:uncharacterized protein RJT21DRAFT_139543 [Scheffersomyces amazonensis]|uniref:uncharacterized protein n=1 Tax=Scheffersomyces amazonensis TaxID=1078765 RepID=UPI00315C4C69